MRDVSPIVSSKRPYSIGSRGGARSESKHLHDGGAAVGELVITHVDLATSVLLNHA
jgi:hypothetical protein